MACTAPPRAAVSMSGCTIEKLLGVTFVLLERTSESKFSKRCRASASPAGYWARILLNCFSAPTQSPARSKSSAAFREVANSSFSGTTDGVATGVGIGVGVGADGGVGVGVGLAVAVGVGRGVIGTGVGVVRRGVTTGVGTAVGVGVT